MEGALFIPPNRPQRRPEVFCAECGHLFRPRNVAEGAEELCDRCYELEFEPQRMRQWEQPGRLHHAR